MDPDMVVDMAAEEGIIIRVIHTADNRATKYGLI